MSSWRSTIAYWKARRFGLVQPDTSPTPTVTGASGTTTVVITGTGFMAAYPRPDAGATFTESVYVGATQVASFVVNSATQITAVPATPWNGTDSVIVNTSGGCGIGGFGAGSTFHLLTEASLGLLTEASDNLRTE